MPSIFLVPFLVMSLCFCVKFTLACFHCLCSSWKCFGLSVLIKNSALKSASPLPCLNHRQNIILGILNFYYLSNLKRYLEPDFGIGKSDWGEFQYLILTFLLVKIIL